MVKVFKVQFGEEIQRNGKPIKLFLNYINNDWNANQNNLVNTAILIMVSGAADKVRRQQPCLSAGAVRWALWGGSPQCPSTAGGRDSDIFLLTTSSAENRALRAFSQSYSGDVPCTFRHHWQWQKIGKIIKIYQWGLSNSDIFVLEIIFHH